MRAQLSHVLPHTSTERQSHENTSQTTKKIGNWQRNWFQILTVGRMRCTCMPCPAAPSCTASTRADTPARQERTQCSTGKRVVPTTADYPRGDDAAMSNACMSSYHTEHLRAHDVHVRRAMHFAIPAHPAHLHTKLHAHASQLCGARRKKSSSDTLLPNCVLSRVSASGTSAGGSRRGEVLRDPGREPGCDPGGDASSAAVTPTSNANRTLLCGDGVSQNRTHTHAH